MRRSGRSPHAITELAQRLKGLAGEHEHNRGSRLERWIVKQTKPLIIEQAEGDLVLEEGDPDFTIGAGLEQFRATYGLEEGDQVLVVRSSNEWHAFDATTDAEAQGGALEAGAYTLSKDKAKRTLDPTTATTEDVANVVATLIRDLGGA